MVEILLLVAKIVGAVAGVVGIAYGFYSKFLKPKVFTKVNAVISKIDKIDIIYKEVTPNGGSSLADKISNIEKNVAGTSVTNDILASRMGILKWRSDAFGATTSVNDVMCTTTNRPESDFLGYNWANTILESDRERVVEAWEDSIRLKKDFVLDYRLTKSDGTIIEISALAKPVKNAAGLVIGYIGSAQIKNPDI